MFHISQHNEPGQQQEVHLSKKYCNGIDDMSQHVLCYILRTERESASNFHRNNATLLRRALQDSASVLCSGHDEGLKKKAAQGMFKALRWTSNLSNAAGRAERQTLHDPAAQSGNQTEDCLHQNDEPSMPSSTTCPDHILNVSEYHTDTDQSLRWESWSLMR